MKTAVITGASRGIGRALAEKFLAEGYFVIGTSRSGSADFSHENLLFLPLELADQDARRACAAAIVARGQALDVLINNAGMYDERDEGPAVDLDALRMTLEVNLIGTIDFTEHVLSSLGEGGHLVNISSRKGSCGYTKDTHYPAYSISKAGLNMYTRKLAVSLAGKATVSCVHPGVVRTRMNPDGDISPKESAEQIFALISDETPSGHFWAEGELFPW